MKEGIVYRRLDKNCIHSRIERIENKVKSSTPDMFLQTDGFNCWIEAKNMTIGVRERMIRVPYEDGQYMWAVKQRAFGGEVYLGIVADDEAYAHKGLFFSSEPREFIARSEFINAFLLGACGTLHYVPNNKLDEFFMTR